MLRASKPAARTSRNSLSLQFSLARRRPINGSAANYGFKQIVIEIIGPRIDRPRTLAGVADGSLNFGIHEIRSRGDFSHYAEGFGIVRPKVIDARPGNRKIKRPFKQRF